MSRPRGAPRALLDDDAPLNLRRRRWRRRRPLHEPAHLSPRRKFDEQLIPLGQAIDVTLVAQTREGDPGVAVGRRTADTQSPSSAAS